jgi:hypothetical protein
MREMWTEKNAIKSKPLLLLMKKQVYLIHMSQDSSVVQHWVTGWMIRDSSPRRDWELFSSPMRPDKLWDPPSLLSNEYQGLSPWG